MSDSRSRITHSLGLRAGEWVQVRSVDEILETLDESGRLDDLPFMPEMLQYCGRRFRVFKSAHKTCDTIERYVARRMTNAVHLGELRCDGAAHDGCQAGCLIFWKEAWLKRASGPAGQGDERQTAVPSNSVAASASRCDIDALSRATRVTTRQAEAQGEHLYSCQATELLRATAPLRWWEPGQYLRDLTSRNVRLHVFILHVLIAAFNVVMRLHWRGRPCVYPYVRGLAGDKTPTEVLNLQAGESVQVRSKDEIRRTLNANNRNRGLSFDVEMVPYCGGTYRVLRRVEKLVDEKTGKMIRPPGACIILDGVTCGGCLSRNRLFCPRSIYPYWHEIWLKRAE